VVDAVTVKLGVVDGVFEGVGEALGEGAEQDDDPDGAVKPDGQLAHEVAPLPE
jgi:hypothetical protein